MSINSPRLRLSTRDSYRRDPFDLTPLTPSQADLYIAACHASMESHHAYDDSMDTTEDSIGNNWTALIETTSPDPFRRKSLLFATYPWLTAIFAVKSTLVKALGDSREDHYAYVRRLFDISIAKSY